MKSFLLLSLHAVNHYTLLQLSVFHVAINILCKVVH